MPLPAAMFKVAASLPRASRMKSFWRLLARFEVAGVLVGAAVLEVEPWIVLPCSCSSFTVNAAVEANVVDVVGAAVVDEEEEVEA